MLDKETPSTPGSYEKDPRPRDFYAETDDGPRHYDDLTTAQREIEADKVKAKLQEAQQELDEILDSANSTAPVNILHDMVDESRDRLQGLGVDDSEASSPKEVVEAVEWQAEDFKAQLEALEEDIRTRMAATAHLKGEEAELERLRIKDLKLQRVALIESVPTAHIQIANAIRRELGVRIESSLPPS